MTSAEHARVVHGARLAADDVEFVTSWAMRGKSAKTLILAKMLHLAPRLFDLKSDRIRICAERCSAAFVINRIARKNELANERARL